MIAAITPPDPWCWKASDVTDAWSAHVFSSGDTTTVVLLGEIDLAAAPEIRRTIANALVSNPARLVIDLSGTTFIDSSGLQALLIAQQTTRLLTVELSIVATTPHVRRVFESAGLDHLVSDSR